MKAGASLPAPRGRSDPEHMAEPAVRKEPEYLVVFDRGQGDRSNMVLTPFQSPLRCCPKHRLEGKAGKGADAQSPLLQH